MATRLDQDELAEALATLTDWTGDLSAIRRTVTVADEDLGPLKVELDKVAREMDHDPHLDRSGRDLTITMSTHSKGGVTELDVSYARRVDVLVAR